MTSSRTAMLIYIAAWFRVKVMKVIKIVTFFNKVFRSKFVMSLNGKEEDWQEVSADLRNGLLLYQTCEVIKCFLICIFSVYIFH
jgi:hypothetical protein